MNLEAIRQRLKLVATPNRRKWGNRLFKVAWGLFLALLLWGIWQFRGQILPYLKGADYRYLLIAVVFYLLTYTFSFLGWYAIIQPFVGIIPWWKHAIIYGFTLAMRRIPGTLWYIGGRLVFYRRLGVSEWDTSVTSSIELVVILASGLLIGLALLPFGFRFPTPIIVLLVGCALAGVLLIQPPVMNRLMRILGRPLKKKVSFLRAWLWLGAYIAVWISGGMMLTQIIHAFRPLTPADAIYGVGAWALSGAAGMLTVFLPSTFGVPELVLAALLSGLMPLPLAGFIAIFTRIICLLAEVLFSAVCYPMVLNTPDLKG